MRYIWLGVLSVALLCACSKTPQEILESTTRSGAPLAGAAIPGFSQTIGTTKFLTGGAVTNVAASGMAKWVGSTGVFAVNNANGAAYGVMHGVKSGGVAFLPYPGGVPAHEALVQAYFVGAGLQIEQIGGVHTNVSARGSGPSGSPFQIPTTFGYSSILTRSVNGITVAESHAWARLNVNGDVVAESVYWPPLDASVVNDAVTLLQMLAVPTQAASYFASLPVSSDLASTGSVVIHHSSEFVETAFQDYACYDVASAHSGMGMAATRHFDKTGAEVRLPQELRTGPSTTRL